MGYFQSLFQKAKTTTNSKETEQIKRKLIKSGLIMLIIGSILTFICFISFTTIAWNGSTNLMLIPFVLFIPSGILVCIGGIVLKLGLGIVVAKATTNFLDVNSYCPHCGDVVEVDEKYCKRCGKPLLANKICSICQTENDMESKYCKNCGNKL